MRQRQEFGIETVGKNFRAVLPHFGEVVLGDENDSLRFSPHVRARKWNETHFAFGLPNSKNYAPDLKFDAALGTEVLDWWESDLDRHHRFYTLPSDGDQREFGGLEYRILLASIPPEPFLDMPISLAGLNLHQQPTFANENRDGSRFENNGRGGERKQPANTAGAIVAMHSSRTVIHANAVDADKYRCGIAFTLYRPKAIDAMGREQWLGLSYDYRAGTIRIVLDPAWFATAAYPVEIDPDVGYNTLGLLTDATNDYALANLYAVGASTLTLTSGSYGGRHTTGTATVYVGTYVEGDGDISANARTGVTIGITLDTTAAFRANTMTGTLTTGTNNFVESFSNTANVETRYTATIGAAGDNQYTNTGVASPPDPHAARSGTQTLVQPSVFVTGDAAGGSCVPSLPLMNVGLCDFPMVSVLGLEWLRRRKNNIIRRMAA